MTKKKKKNCNYYQKIFIHHLVLDVIIKKFLNSLFNLIFFNIINIFYFRASIILFEENLSDLIHILKSVSDEKISEMRQQVCFLWEKYFSSMKKITNTVLEILNERIFPQNAHTYEEWNDLPLKVNYYLFFL